MVGGLRGTVVVVAEAGEVGCLEFLGCFHFKHRGSRLFERITNDLHLTFLFFFVFTMPKAAFLMLNASVITKRVPNC